MSNKLGIIYQALNTANNMSYVGQTIRTLKERKSGKYNKYFSNAIKKYGDIIQWTILAEVSLKELDRLEKYYISELNSLYPNGYNFETGGNKHKQLSSISKKKMSKSHKGKKMLEKNKKELSKRMLGNQYRSGKSLSSSHKQKISEANTGKICSLKTRKKLSSALMGNKNNLGRKMSIKTKQKISEANTGKIRSDEIRKKMSEWLVGKKLSKEHRQKISHANIGRVVKECTRIKIGAGNAKNTYKILKPNDEIEIIKNISRYCRENNLCVSSMVAVSKGRRNHHKGYRCERVEDNN